MQYDFFIAGRWRNSNNISPVLQAVRKSGKTAYCFIENQYEGEKVEFRADGNIDNAMSSLEMLTQTDDLVQAIFENDMRSEKNSENFLLVLPAGISGHIEAGVAYGMGKRCFAIGTPDKTETLYCIFEKIFSDINEFTEWLENN